MKKFRVATNLILVALIIALPLHVILLLSDSESYRFWVYVQMSLLAALIGLLLCLRKANVYLLTAFAVLSFAATSNNAVVLNYGNGIGIWILSLLALSYYVWLG